jgi:hypothetical protein
MAKKLVGKVTQLMYVQKSEVLGQAPRAASQGASSSWLQNIVEEARLRVAISQGIRDENQLTNQVFFARHPERAGQKLSRGAPQFEQLAQEWLDIRNRLVRPVMQGLATKTTSAVPATTSVPADTPRGPFGTLAGPHFSYVFTPEDVLWTARFIKGEAGGRDDRDNQAVIWAMFNRYALFTHKYYPTFHQFIRAYSTPLQPVLKSWGAAKRHMHKPEFVRTGGYYDPPHADIPRGQLRRHLQLQATPWGRLPQPARALALRALTGQVPNPIGNASEFGSTYVYFHDKHKRYPTDAEWRQYTEAYARRKKWIWIGPVSDLNQKKNTFFVQKRVANLAAGAVRLAPPT